MSTAKFNTWVNPDGTENYKCRAWVNFNGTGTVAIRASGNVSSITDNGTGDYTVNFTNALPDANYGVTGLPTNAESRTMQVATNSDGGAPLLNTTSAVRISNRSTASTAFVDSSDVSVAIFR